MSVHINDPGICCRAKDIQGGPKKTAHGFLCSNFAYSQSFFIIFLAHIHYRKFATG